MERRRDRLEGTEKPVATSQRMLKTIFSRIMMSSDVFGVGRDKSGQVDTDRGDNFNAFVPSSRVDNVTGPVFATSPNIISIKRGDRVSIFPRPRSQCRLSPVKNFQFAFLFFFFFICDQLRIFHNFVLLKFYSMSGRIEGKLIQS